MLVFIQKNLAILSVPKTGTTAYVAALRRRASVVISSPPGLKHTNLSKFQRSFLPIFQNATPRPIETMAVVREPIDWLGSWYRYRQRDQLDRHENSTKGMSYRIILKSDHLQGYLRRAFSFGQIPCQKQYVPFQLRRGH